MFDILYSSVYISLLLKYSEGRNGSRIIEPWDILLPPADGALPTTHHAHNKASKPGTRPVNT